MRFKQLVGISSKIEPGGTKLIEQLFLACLVCRLQSAVSLDFLKLYVQINRQRQYQN